MYMGKFLQKAFRTGSLILCFTLILGLFSGCTLKKSDSEDSPDKYVSKGDRLLKKDDVDGAIEAYRKAIDIDKTCEEAYLKLAEIYIDSGDEDEARSILKKAKKKIGEDNLTHKFDKLCEQLEGVDGSKDTESVAASDDVPENNPDITSALAPSDSIENQNGEVPVSAADETLVADTPAGPVPGEIIWTDSTLEQAVRDALDIPTDPITEEYAAHVSFISLSDAGIEHIGDLKYFTALKNLDINNNNISDISVLKELPSLEELHMEGNPVANPEIVLELENLKTVYLPEISMTLIYKLRTSGRFSSIYINGIQDYCSYDSKSENGRLQETISQMNSDMFSLQRINIYEDNYSVGIRNTDYKWDQTTFYALEGISSSSLYINKNLCDLTKKELINAVTGNIIDYEIYTDPSTGISNKIVSIEYIDDGLEIMEFYFDKDAKVSFVFHYYVDNYISTYATPAMSGERFLFNNDTLVTWRKITSDSTANYVIGSKEADRLKSSWASSSIKKYSSIDSDLQSQFDRNEKDMLNAAYNTYNFVLSAEGIARIQGYVYDSGSEPLSDAVIGLYSEDETALLYTGMTGTDGSYSIYVPSDEENYMLTVSKDGFRHCKIFGIAINSDQVGAFQDTAYLFDTSDSDVTVSMTLGDAFNRNSYGTGMLLLQYADVYFREGMNNRYGDVVYIGQTDSNGYLSIPLMQGEYTIEVIASGYETMYYTILANPKTSNIYEFYTAPTLDENEVAIVLTWGDYPSDLDSHLFTTKGNTTNHIWFGRKTDSDNNYLDVDDTSAYGPETVTIRKFKTTDYYKYCVVDYSDCAWGNYSSLNMSNSGATVNVYTRDGLIGTFHVPTNTEGVIWEVFEIRNGRITTIQRYYNNVTDKTWWHSDK